MSSGFVHVMSLLSMWVGLMAGAFCAKKFRNWYLFFFVLAVLIGWIIHVIWFDMIYIVLKDMLNKIYVAKFA